MLNNDGGEVPAIDINLNTPSGAVLSACGRYRYWLHRRWLTGEGVAVWVMLNPSTAGPDQDDPTIRRVTRFSERWGYQAAVVVNLCALRATNPSALAHEPDLDRPLNHHCLDAAARLAKDHGRLILAWGACPHQVWGEGFVQAVRRAGVTPYCLGHTRDGHPRHPLYVRADTELVPFEGYREAADD